MPEIPRSGGRDAEIRVREFHNVQKASGLEKVILTIALAAATVVAVVAVKSSESQRNVNDASVSKQPAK